LDTTQEMCYAITLYYPRIPVGSCVSEPGAVDEIMLQTLGIQETRYTWMIILIIIVAITQKSNAPIKVFGLFIYLFVFSKKFLFALLF